MISLFFILIIIFMISNSVVFWTGTRVETSLSLPTVRSVELNVADKMIITITRSGEVFFNEKSLDWHELQRELGERVRESRIAMAKVSGLDPERDSNAHIAPMVIVRADKNISYETISRVMDLARSLDLNVYLAADPPANAAPEPIFVPDGAGI
ncbi:MAG: biopolymer transporter ExbD [Lentisphaeria bacterium]|nr:biopolymer transporter ExbD [Lentisphaeria bacterium]